MMHHGGIARRRRTKAQASMPLPNTIRSVIGGTISIPQRVTTICKAGIITPGGADSSMQTHTSTPTVTFLGIICLPIAPIIR